MKRVWVVPVNDAEAVEIRKLLAERGERVLTSNQRWGASWAGLEPEIKRELLRGAAATIYGIELAGANPYGAVNIDHHKYGDQDDRTHPLSSLEQVAEILGATPLSRWQTLVALNDRGYIPAMEKDGGATVEEVAAVRRADRAAQGVTAEQEEAAARDLREHAVFSDGGRRVKVWCASGSTAAHSDALHGKAREILLIGPGEWNYYGPRHRELAAMFGGVENLQTWSGGAPESGYFGMAAPDESVGAQMLAWWEAESATWR